jgi:TetR/AcrR family transcriptional regulator
MKRIDPNGDPASELRRYIIQKIKMSEESKEASRLFASEIGRGAPLLKPFLETRLRSLVDDEAQILRGWMEAGKLLMVDPYHLIFVIWATTQHYADFEVQIGAILGDAAEDEDFYDKAGDAVLSIILHGVLPNQSN